jgi:fumarate hydratase class II
MGELQVPADALYGAQTQRAINNFPISGLTMPPNAVNLLPFLLRGHDSHLATKLGSDLIFHARTV